MLKSIALTVAALGPMPMLAQRCEPPPAKPSCPDPITVDLGGPPLECELLPGSVLNIMIPVDQPFEGICANAGGAINWNHDPNYQVSDKVACLIINP